MESIIGRFNPDFSLDRSKTETSPNFFEDVAGDAVFDPVEEIRDNLGIDNDAPTGTDPTVDLPDSSGDNMIDQKLEDLFKPLPEFRNPDVDLDEFMPPQTGGNNPQMDGGGLKTLIRGITQGIPVIPTPPMLQPNNTTMKTRNMIIIGLAAIVGLFGLTRVIGGSQDAGGDMS
jgi:hypothetical protein